MNSLPPERPLSTIYRKGQPLEVEISDLAEGDRCFGRLPDGPAVFVQGRVAVGDRVEAEIVKIKKNLLEARLIRLLAGSDRRVVPHCRHFGACGGCKWQHVEYAEQLRIKQKLVSDALRHLGGFEAPPVADVVACPDPYRYRNKLEFSFGRRRYLLDAEAENRSPKPPDFALGFHAPGLFDKVVDIDACEIATAEMNETLEEVKAFARERALSIYSTRTHDGYLRSLVVRQSFSTGAVMVNLVTSWPDQTLLTALGERLRQRLGGRLATLVNNVTRRKNNAAVGDEEFVVFGPGHLIEEVGGARFKISANSFFQTHTGQAGRLYEQALRMADLQPAERAYDLYCGTGALGILAAPHCQAVLGIDVVPGAIADAEANAALNGRANCSFVQLDLKHLRQPHPVVAAFGRPDVILVDPPRAGIHPDALPVILNLAPKRVVYVSCNPASLARDARWLRDSGRYGLCEVTPVDMFPQTYHIECVARFDLVE
jgi:23S rRNA (uracil1939-C5)-methyltransferase